MFTQNLPHHLYCYVNTAFTHKEPRGLMPAVFFAITSTPGRAWGCHVLLENGAVYRNLPPNALFFADNSNTDWLLQESQHWDCYGWRFATIEYEYLKGLRCEARCGEDIYHGEYLFTAAPFDDGFSLDPGQNKEFMFIKLNNGALTIQPTDRVVFKDKSFTSFNEWPRGMRLGEEIYKVE
jgi:hypothetical protein